MRQKREACGCVIRGQPLVWPTSNKSYRPITILALRMQFSIGNRILKGAHLSLRLQADTCCLGHTSALKSVIFDDHDHSACASFALFNE